MSVSVEVTRRRFTLGEYHRMSEAGILNEDDRVELIRGEIVQMTPIGSRHAFGVTLVASLFSRRLLDRAVVWSQNPLTIFPDSEPEPDVVLLRPPLARYRDALPVPADVLLVVEVADASIRYDRQVKGPLHAEAGVPEYWIVDVEGEALEVHRDPRDQEYRSVERRTRGQSIAPLAFSDLVIAIDELLG